MSTPVQPYWLGLMALLKENLSALYGTKLSLIERSEKAMGICRESVRNLKKGLDSYVFKDKIDETSFFKNIRPAFHSQLIYHSRVFQIEIGRPPGGIPDQDTYLKKELQRLKEFFDDNKFMYQYLRTNSTYLDEKLFFRPTDDTAYAFRMYSIDNEPDHPTSFDFLVSQIKANELLQSYLTEAQDELYRPKTFHDTLKSTLVWTESKTALIELAYGLQSVGALNDGKAELKEIVEVLQILFQIDLGHYPRTFQEILSRKTGYTNFIDKIRDKLLLRIKTIEDKHIR